MDRFLSKFCSVEWLGFIEFHKSTLDLEKGKEVFQSGERVDGIYFIQHGKVKVVRPGGSQSSNGRLVRLANTGDILGHRGFGKEWTYPVSAITLTEATVDFLPTNVFQQVVKGNPDLAYYLIMFYAEELKSSEELNCFQAPVKTRVARAIQANLDAFGYDKDQKGLLSYTLARKDIASYAGTTYETVIRVLGEMNKEEVIEIVGKKIKVLDEKKLRGT